MSLPPSSALQPESTEVVNPSNLGDVMDSSDDGLQQGSEQERGLGDVLPSRKSSFVSSSSRPIPPDVPQVERTQCVVNPRDLGHTMDSSDDVLQQGSEKDFKLGTRSRTSSFVSSSSDLTEMEVDKEAMTGVQSAVESEDSDNNAQESDSDNDSDDPMDGLGSNEDKNASADSALAESLADVGLRRSSRNKQTQRVCEPLPLPSTRVVEPLPLPKTQKHVEPLPLPKVSMMRKPSLKKDRIPVLVSVRNNLVGHRAKCQLFRVVWKIRDQSSQAFNWQRWVFLFLPYDDWEWISTCEDSSTPKCMPRLLDGDRQLRLVHNPIAMSPCKLFDPASRRR